MPIQKGMINPSYSEGFSHGLTRMERSRYNLIAIPAGKLLGEYNVALVG